MIEKKETREVYYALSRKLLNLMLQSGYLDREEYEKIDVSKKVWYCVVRKEET